MFKVTPSLKHKLNVSLVVVLCLMAAVVVLLPVAIQVGAQSWLRDQGLDADIEFVGFNLNSGTFSLENARGKNPEGKGFEISKLLVEINWKPMFSKVLDVQRIEIVGLTLDIKATKQGLQVAGISLPASDPAKTEAEAVKEGKPVEWAVQLQQVLLSGINVCHEVPVTGEKDPALTIEQMMNACVSLKEMKWLGKIAWSAPADKQPAVSGVSIIGDLLFDSLSLASKDLQQTYAAFEKMALNGISITGLNQFRTSSIELFGVRLLQHTKSEKGDSPYLATWKLLNIKQAEFNQQQQTASIDSIYLDGLDSVVDHSAEGIAGLPVIADKPGKNKQKQETSKAPAFGFSVNEIHIDGNSRISIIDKTVDPVFQENVSAINIIIRDLDSLKAEQKSPLNGELKVGEYGEVNIKGNVQPFMERITLDLQQNTRNIDLANFNVYGKTFIGHRIRRGNLELEQKLVINQGKLDTSSTLVLQKFEIEALEGKEAEKYKSDLGIPLSAALSLLRDRDDRIKLTVPVTGDIDAPDFSLNDIIATVTSKAIKEAIINYYTPFGLVKLVGGAFNLATALRFDPVEFVAGKVDISDDSAKQLDKLATLLKERPQVHLTMCGYPVRSDALASYKPAEIGLKKADEQTPLKLTEKQTSELLNLFKSRMNNMKQYMVKQLKTNPGQVILCSEPDKKDWAKGIDAKPEIAISL